MGEIAYITHQPNMDMDKLYADSKEDTLPGFPSPDQRLTFEPEEWREMVENDCIELPDGPWHVDFESRYERGKEGKIDRLVTKECPATAAQLKRWGRVGLMTTLGLALHPLAEVGFTTTFADGSKVGMFTGPGRHWRYGPQLVVNLGVRRKRKGEIEYLTVGVERAARREDGDMSKPQKKIRRSLPGGHAEGTSAYQTALKEGKEETGIGADLLQHLPGQLITTVPSLFGPNTAVSWLDERYLMLNAGHRPDIANFVPEPEDTDEIVEASWMTLEAIREDKSFLGSHLKEINAFEASIAAKEVQSW